MHKIGIFQSFPRFAAIADEMIFCSESLLLNNWVTMIIVKTDSLNLPNLENCIGSGSKYKSIS